MSNSVEFKKAIGQNPFFAELGPAVLQLLSARARLTAFPAGSTIFHEGDPSPGLFWLQSGTLKAVKYAASGREQTLHLVQAGQTFNEVGAFTTLPNPATVVALTDVEVWQIHSEAIGELVSHNPDFSQSIINMLSIRLRHTVALIEDLSLRPVISRLARLILEEADGDTLSRPNWYTQNELAARLGTVTDVVQRALRKLEADELIELQRHQILIKDHAKLSQLTN